MGNITIRPNRYGTPAYRAQVRITGFPAKSKTFFDRDRAEEWILEQEAIIHNLLGNELTPKAQEAIVKLGVDRGGGSITLRGYQQKAVAACIRALWSDPLCTPLIVQPTGAGKSLVIAGIIERIIGLEPDARIIVLTHSQELVAQDYEKYLAYSGIDPIHVGILSAGLNRKEYLRPVTFSTIQTATSLSEVPAWDYVLIDEAHMIPRKEEAMYQRLLDRIKTRRASVRVAGVTATPYRMDSGLLTDGDDALFSEIVFETGVRELVRDGFLSPLVSLGSIHHVDDEKLNIRGHDFDERSSASAMMGLTPQILSEIIACGSSRRAWMVYCVNIKHAEQVAEAISREGIDCRTVTSRNRPAVNAANINDLRAGKARGLVSVDSLTTGIDVPQVDMIVSLRPTLSAGLWVQICGRGMRRAGDKKDCLVLDFANNIARHGPIDLIQSGLRASANAGGGGKRSTSTRTCLSCGTKCSTILASCPNCGAPLLEARGPALSDSASTLPVMIADGFIMDSPSEERHDDLRSILDNYIISDISSSLRPLLSSSHSTEIGLKQHFKLYLELLKTDVPDNYHDFLPEPGWTIEDLAMKIGINADTLAKDIQTGLFPKPRLTLDTGEAGYSLLQVAAIMNGELSSLLRLDETFLWYQHLAANMEFELVASHERNTHVSSVHDVDG